MLMVASLPCVLTGRTCSRATGQFSDSVRFFSVKQLPWCAPSDAPTRPARTMVKPKDDFSNFQPIKRFGIIAAVSACRNRVIGMNGRLPWSLPEDRKLFKSLTRDGVIIIGRRTLEEHSNLVHVDHARSCIVVSKTIENLDYYQQSSDSVTLHRARSFPEALHLARELNDEGDIENIKALSCWVAGGEKIYEEALKHASAAELHISWVQQSFSLRSNDETSSRKKSFAQFPAKYRWDNKFKPVSEKAYPKSETSLAFVYKVYKPLRVRGTT
eukprot:scaffold1900_cov123-Cylindrotheca_fusiformis.AAC.9